MTFVFVLFFFLLFMGMPIGIILGVAGVMGIMDAGGGAGFLSMAPKRFFAGLNLFPFLAMPFFILAGEIMNHTGITHRLILFAESLVGFMRGGLAHTNMVASVFFAGITGAATADAAAFGKTLVPAMVKQGYPRSYGLCGHCRRLNYRSDDPAKFAHGYLWLDHGRINWWFVRSGDIARIDDLPHLHGPDCRHGAPQEPAKGA